MNVDIVCVSCSLATVGFLMLKSLLESAGPHHPAIFVAIKWRGAIFPVCHGGGERLSTGCQCSLNAVSLTPL